jgi:DNA-binding NarL/FixJ family response regulator
MGGAELASLLTQLVPEAKLLAWTVSEASDDLIRMFRAGCSGYVLKDSGPDEMRRALLAAMRDDAPIPRKMLPEVIRKVVPPLGSSGVTVRLTPRESDVLRLLARGEARKQMAIGLGISMGSIDTHVKSLYRKLGVSSQTEAVNAGLRIGLVRVEDL